MIFRLILTLSLFCASALGIETARVVAFSPEGSVKQVRQVHASFSEAMIPFGNLEDSVQPFHISCSEKGHARWADTKNWIFDFDQDLPGGVHCDFALRPGLKSLAGQDLVGNQKFSFHTGGPAILDTTPYEGSTIQEDQAFYLHLDQAVSERWIAENVFFWVDGIQEKIPVQIVGKAEKKKILKGLGTAHADNQSVVLQARRVFPYGAAVTLEFGSNPDAPQKLKFEVRKEFTAKINCERESLDSGCIPLSPISLVFSNAVPVEQAKKALLRSADGKTWHPKQNSDDGESTVYSEVFEGPFPEKSILKLSLPPGLKDESDRALSNVQNFPLDVKMDQLPPLAKFSAEFGILESGPTEASLPVTVRNLENDGKIRGKMKPLGVSPKVEDLVNWLAQVNHQRDGAGRGHSILTHSAANFLLPQPAGTNAFEVMGIPLKKPGLYVVELESKILGQKLLGKSEPMYVSTVALVTGMGVHFKQGRESSLAWVTSLANAQPVPDAVVEVRNCHGALLAQGKTDRQGRLKLPGISDPMPTCTVPDVYSPYLGGIFVTARKAADFSFAHSSWDHGLEYWRFNLAREYAPSPTIAHTVFDRDLVRAGEKLHMKHFARRHGSSGFVPIPGEQLPGRVQFQHVGSGEKYEFPIQWSPSAASETTWEIPNEAKRGVYEVSLINRKGQVEMNWPSGKFRVEEFRVPLMKGTIRPPAEPLVGVVPAPVDLSVNYLAGGGAGFLPVQFRYQSSAATGIHFPDYESFAFANGAIQLTSSREDSTPETTANRLRKKSLTLDKTGATRVVLTDWAEVQGAVEGSVQGVVPGAVKTLSLELEYRDPNGEVQTTSASLPIYPSRRLVGVQADWSDAKKLIQLKTVVVDLKGSPLAGVPVEVDFIQQKFYSHRKKIIGGFYSYDNRSEIKNLGSACRGVTDAKGFLACSVPAPAAGSISLQASVRDEASQVSIASTSVYVYNLERAWFPQSDDDRIDILPERKRYEPGETAKFQVQMPFAEANALVTVEREGVLDSFVVPISGKNPVVEVPIRKNYAPNVYISVLALRGRVGDVQPAAAVDLGKPAFKLGIAEIQVGWKANELNVQVRADRDLYQIREKAHVKVHVTAADGTSLPKDSEVAIAAVDEGLLQLSPNDSWQLLEAMLNRRGYEVATFTSQMEIVGKRHFGLKAVPHGGGGGNTPTRELFDTLLFWKPSVVLDPNGDAEVDVPLNDSVTSFRIVAIGSSGLGRFGTGSTSIRTSQDLTILSGIAPVVREGDEFPAEFTLRNSTTNPLDLDVSARITGLGKSLPTSRVTLEPGESKIVSWPVTVPKDRDSLQYEISAVAKSSSPSPTPSLYLSPSPSLVTPRSRAHDKIKVTQKVIPLVPVQVVQATLIQVEGEVHLPVKRPADALPKKGGIDISLRPSLAVGLAGVKEYMKAYPYACLEQRASKAIALGDNDSWKHLMRDLPTYLDGEGLAKYFPGNISESMAEGSDALTAYLLAVAQEAGWKIPESEQSRMIAGLQKFIEGGGARKKDLRTTDLTIRKIAALEAIARFGGAQATQLSSLEIAPNLWPTSAVIDWLSILQRVKDIPAREVKMRETEEIIRARLNFQGTRLGFSTEQKDRLDWLMVSPDVNANRLILTLMDSQTWPDLASDMPRLVRGSLQRQVRGHWNITVADAWGTLALDKFSHQYEAVTVQGHTKMTLGVLEREMDWAKKPQGDNFSMPWRDSLDTLKIHHQGVGKPWAIVQSRAAIPRLNAISTGYKIAKICIPIEQKIHGRWSRGDIVKVHLQLESQADSNWVVVNDPIPAGASVLGTGLGNDSSLTTQTEKSEGWVWPAFEERRLDSFRTYYTSVPKGKWTVEYTVRLNQVGLMHLPPTRVEAMYLPEFFGELPNADVQVVREQTP
jgi:hypothetical protein